MYRSNIQGGGQRRQAGERGVRRYEGAAAADAAGFARARAIARAHGGIPLRRGGVVPRAHPKDKNTPSGAAHMKSKKTKK